MYSATLQKVRGEEEPTFQLQVLKNFQKAKNHYDAHYLEYYSQVCIQKRLAWSDDIIFMLGTQGWLKLIDENDDLLHMVFDEEPIDGTDGHVEMKSTQNRDKFSRID